jgi:hypothetical protein
LLFFDDLSTGGTPVPFKVCGVEGALLAEVSVEAKKGIIVVRLARLLLPDGKWFPHARTPHQQRDLAHGKYTRMA